MKKRELEELRKSKMEDLQKKATELRAEIVQNSVKIAASEVTNLKLVKNLRKDLAQVLTLIKLKEKQNK